MKKLFPIVMLLALGLGLAALGCSKKNPTTPDGRIDPKGVGENAIMG